MTSVRGAVRRLLKAAGLNVIRSPSGAKTALFGYELRPNNRPDPHFEYAASELPLLIDRANLRRLTEEYRQHPVNTDPGGVWQLEGRSADQPLDVDLATFRGDNAYIYQTRLAGTLNYLVGAMWAQATDSHDLLDLLDEDGAFGAASVSHRGRLWSRDLIDSVLEIGFLLDHLPVNYLATATVLDIGAGYGRFAHRLVSALDGPSVLCTDGIAYSTELSRAYVRFRGIGARVRVLTLDELEHLDEPVTLATNMHSFSEMPPSAVRWWLDWLEERSVHFLFIVPNRPGPAMNDGSDLTPLLHERGYRLHAHRAKYSDPLVNRYAVVPADYYLFRRS